jgi:hypothetical protein
VNVAPAATFEAVLEAGTSGLVGTLTVEANDNQGVTAIAATSLGITEIASGVYAATGLVAPSTAGQYTLIWKAAGAGVQGIEDLVVTYSAPGSSVPTAGPYATLEELQRRIGKETGSTAAEIEAMNLMLQEGAEKIDWELGYTAAAPAPTPIPALIVDVNLRYAQDLWRLSKSTFGAIPQGPELGQLIAPRDLWYRYHLELTPLRVHEGIA